EKEKDATGTELVTLRERLSDEETQGDEAEAQIILLNEQIAALRLQLASLEEALDAADARDREQKAVIQDLGSRLNVALAQKVQELATYRSSFFEALQNALGERAEIEVVGDRFVLQSEILFASGSATINPDGRQELAKIAEVINEISSVIPDDVAWIIRVDGHSDVVPISTPEFPSNWHLSAARAIAVVRFLTARGVDPMHLAAAGFGEFDPLAEGRDPATLRRNRRIEFKLTDR
ncbi:MAG: peptidoglycan-binding protein, partial [Pseudomonadota bacterium]